MGRIRPRHGRVRPGVPASRHGDLDAAAVGRERESLAPKRLARIGERGTVGRVVADEVDVEEVMPGRVDDDPPDTGALAVVRPDGAGPALVGSAWVADVDPVHHLRVRQPFAPTPRDDLGCHAVAVVVDRVLVEVLSVGAHHCVEDSRLDDFSFVHVVRELGDGPRRTAQQGVRIHLPRQVQIAPHVPLEPQLLRNVIGLILEDDDPLAIRHHGIDPGRAERRRW